jgi:hypothetical protein
MKVTVTEGCNRCNREVPVEIDSSEIPEREKALDTRTAAREEVVTYLEGQKNAPDLVVLFKGKVRTIDRVCDAHCVSPVNNGLDAIFKTIDPSKRKPRKPKPDADAKGGSNGADAKGDTKGGSKKEGKSGVKDKPSQTAASK